MIRHVSERKINLSKLYFILFPMFGLVSACSSVNLEPYKPEPEPISVITGKTGGIKLAEFNKSQTSGDRLPVNALLWRAALDIASFVPLDDVDTFGGSIVTEWYQSANNSDQRLKLVIFVVGLELRSDAVKVKTYTQKKLGNDWTNTGSDDELARKIEDLILARARELRGALMPETAQ